MTSWQEERRNAILEQRRKEHERYAAERLAKVNAICTLACKHGISYGRYIAERSKIMDEENRVTTAETPTAEPRKRGIREPLPPEKIERVREMLAEGKKKSEIITETLVSRTTIDRIENGTYGVKQSKRPSKAAEPAAITTPEVSKSDKHDILRRLILEVKCCLSSAPTFEDKEEGYVLGLLTAAELLLGTE